MWRQRRDTILVVLVAASFVGLALARLLLPENILTPFNTFVLIETCTGFALLVSYYFMRKAGVSQRMLRLFAALAGVTVVYMLYMPIDVQLASFAIWGVVSLVTYGRVIAEYRRREYV